MCFVSQAKNNQENFLMIPLFTSLLSFFQVQMANDWMCFADSIHEYTSTTQNYVLMAYLPFLPVTFHMLFASNAPQKINYPHSQFEVSSPKVETLCALAPFHGHGKAGFVACIADEDQEEQNAEPDQHDAGRRGSVRQEEPERDDQRHRVAASAH